MLDAAYSTPKEKPSLLADNQSNKSTPYPQKTKVSNACFLLY